MVKKFTDALAFLKTAAAVALVVVEAGEKVMSLCKD